MNTTLQSVIVGGIIGAGGTIIASVVNMLTPILKRRQDRLDTIFLKRLEYYSEINLLLFKLDETTRLNKEAIEQTRRQLHEYWCRVSVYLPRTISEKIHEVVVLASAMVENKPDPISRDKYTGAITEAKNALMDLKDVHRLA